MLWCVQLARQDIPQQPQISLFLSTVIYSYERRHEDDDGEIQETPEYAERCYGGQRRSQAARAARQSDLGGVNHGRPDSF